MSSMASQLGCMRSALGGLISRHRRQGGTLFPPRVPGNQHGGARRAKLEAPIIVVEDAHRSPPSGLQTAKSGLSGCFSWSPRAPKGVLAALRTRWNRGRPRPPLCR